MSSPFEHRRHHRAAAHVEGEKIEEACNIRPGMCTNNYSSMSSLWEHTNAQLTICRFSQKQERLSGWIYSQPWINIIKFSIIKKKVETTLDVNKNIQDKDHFYST